MIARASELKWPMTVSLTVNKVNLHEVVDMFAAAALCRPEVIQIGAVMAEGRARNRLDLMLSRAEWESVKKIIRGLPYRGVSYAFCDEFFCSCRDFPAEWRQRFGAGGEPCSAGKNFGVIGPNGKFRKCLHTVDEFEWREHKISCILPAAHHPQILGCYRVSRRPVYEVNKGVRVWTWIKR